MMGGGAKQEVSVPIADRTSTMRSARVGVRSSYPPPLSPPIKGGGLFDKENHMCLAVPMTITKIEGTRAVAEARGVETMVDISLMPDVKINDKVIVHAGFIIERLDEKEAGEIDRVWDQYLEQLDKEESA